MYKEFKDFILKGDVVGLAVAVIIAGAFGKIVTAITDAFLTPIIGIVLGGKDLSDMYFTAGGTVWRYGLVVQATFVFLMTALVLFFIVKAANKANPPAPEAPAGPSETDLLGEIRDLLRK